MDDQATALRYLAQRTGHSDSAYGSRLVRVESGSGDGVMLAEVWNAVGLRMEVVVGRGFDIYRTEYMGSPVHWQAPPGLRSRHSYEPQGWGWLRNFHGGLLVTCGLEHVLMPMERMTPEYNFLPDMPRQFGLHGRVSNEAGEILERRLVFVGGEPVVRISGVVAQAALYGERFRLQRTIDVPVYSPEIRVSDVVRNIGYQETHHELLYHINVGYPLVDAGTEIRMDTTQGAERVVVTDPVASAAERVTGYALTRDADGWSHVEVADSRRQRRLRLDYDASRMPYFYLWYMIAEGVYAIGLEPSTASRPDERVSRDLTYMAPQEEVQYELRFKFG